LFCCRAVARCCAPCGPIWLRPRVSVVSFYVKRKKWEIRWKGRDVTLFCFRAVARCCAPRRPIWLSERCSVVSVYVKQKEWEIRWKGRDVTLFCWRAVAICCAPSSPIWLLPRFSVVSVYVKQKEWDIGWKVGILHCFVGGQWQDYVPLHYRFDCLEGEVWWVSMWNKKNERLDEKVWMLHCFVGEQWQDVVLLHDRSDCSWGWVWWVSMWNKNNEGFVEEVGILVYMNFSPRYVCPRHSAHSLKSVRTFGPNISIITYFTLLIKQLHSALHHALLEILVVSTTKWCSALCNIRKA
jgi:hypothetical protein